MVHLFEGGTTKFKIPSEITPPLKNVYDAIKPNGPNGKDQKVMRVCSEIKNKMQVEIDQFEKPFFKADELLDASQIKCLLTSIEQKNWTIECEICKKKFSSKKNLASHTKNNHSQYENEIMAKSKEYVREIFNSVPITGKAHRKDVALEIELKMKNGMDELGQPLFEGNEILDLKQIEFLLVDFKKNENKKKCKKGDKNGGSATTVKKKTKTMANSNSKSKSKVQTKLEYFDDTVMVDGENIKFDKSIEITVVDENNSDHNQIESTTKYEHPVMLGDIVVCDLAKSIMNSELNAPSPLNDLDNKTLISIGDMVGSQVQNKDLSARDRKKEAKFREIENAVVNYVTENCSCYQDIYSESNVKVISSEK